MELTSEIIYKNFEILVAQIFALPETVGVRVRDVIIQKGDSTSTIHEKAIEIKDKSYHDILSDIDLCVIVKKAVIDTVNQDTYMRMISRYGMNEDTCLGIAFVPESKMYRIIKKDGMRYDFGFEFQMDENAPMLSLSEDEIAKATNIDKKAETANRFWFIEIQALAKLYRRDYLISDHLANMLLNETLVIQMLMRDEQYGTNHHRYGYSEDLEYLHHIEGKCVFRRDAAFDRIADKLYGAAITFDILQKQYDKSYSERSSILFELWTCYDKVGLQ